MNKPTPLEKNKKKASVFTGMGNQRGGIKRICLRCDKTFVSHEGYRRCSSCVLATKDAEGGYSPK